MRTKSRNSEIDPLVILTEYYPEENALRKLLLRHSEQVRDKALRILRECPFPERKADPGIVASGAMLHDIGIRCCNAPSIHCFGERPYIAHGLAGGAMLREYGLRHGVDLERFARICERHTGSGLTAEEIRNRSLPLPEQDFLPETLEEKLICLADKFYSKSGGMREKSLSRIRASMEKFGADSLRRFDALCAFFGVADDLACGSPSRNFPC